MQSLNQRDQMVRTTWQRLGRGVARTSPLSVLPFHPSAGSPSPRQPDAFLLLHIGQALAFAFNNIGPITILELAKVSWTLDGTENNPTDLRLLVLAANGTGYETIGNFVFSLPEYIFNITDGNLPPGGNYSWFIYGETVNAPEFISDTFDILAAGSHSSISSPSSSPTSTSSQSPAAESTSSVSGSPSAQVIRPFYATALPTTHHNTALIVGIVIGMLALLALIALALFLLRRRRQRANGRLLAVEAHSAGQIDAFPPHFMSQSASTSVYTAFSKTHLVPAPPPPVLASKATRRQAHLAAQMEAIHAEMAELARLHPAPSAGAGSSTSSGAGAYSAAHFAVLQARIRDLEAHATSEFARGLSDEPPPGYSP
ncbi:hypothetical protein DFH09DRAFT_1370135 [Mycena vulgaris]|nr:hypothetical protein DFH09DRAFT_1370135 [Mycena vulgaris]